MVETHTQRSACLLLKDKQINKQKKNNSLKGSIMIFFFPPEYLWVSIFFPIVILVVVRGTYTWEMVSLTICIRVVKQQIYEHWDKTVGFHRQQERTMSNERQKTSSTAIQPQLVILSQDLEAIGIGKPGAQAIHGTANIPNEKGVLETSGGPHSQHAAAEDKKLCVYR